MNLIFIYGPPASGKLTVAKKLAKLTGYKIFHNHLTVDTIIPIFDFGTPAFAYLASLMRFKIFKTACKYGIKGLIFTYCYSYTQDDKFVKKVIRIINKNGGHVHFVQLYCDKGELFKRVGETSRRDHNKIRIVAKLKAVIKQWDLFTPMPYGNSLRIDNTKVTPLKAAQLIRDHYKL